MAFTDVYDACVLYPVRLRDFLLRAVQNHAEQVIAKLQEIREDLGSSLDLWLPSRL